jgi:uncharacterized protein
MWRSLLRSLMLVAIAGSVVTWPARPAQAVEIRDGAGFFSQKALDKANARLAELKNDYGREVRIETFKTVPGGRGGEVARMDKADRERFFEKWARERATSEHARGIFILICKQPGHVQVEDDRLARSDGFGNAERAELRGKFLAGFRDNDYDKGLLDGVDYAVRELKKLKPHTGEAGPAAGTHRGDQRAVGHDSRDFRQAPARHNGMGWLSWVLLIVAILIGIRLVGALFSGSGGGGGGYGPGGYGYGGGGGFMGGLMSGLFGAFAGNWLYHQFFDTPAYGGTPVAPGAEHQIAERDDNAGAGEDWQGSGGDFGDDSGSDGGGDFGDSGGGDFGGGDSGGGDFGGGDFGGGDFGGGGDF